MPYCNSDSEIIQAILRFNLIVSRFKLAKIYTALNKENGASAKAYSSNIFAANGIFIRWRLRATISCMAKIYTALNKEKRD